MGKSILLFLFINCCSIAHCQVAKGTILDQKTKKAICCASVYFNGTFARTTSDTIGYFELNRSEHLSMPLTTSAIGYYSFLLTDFTSKPLLIYLKPKEYELKGTVVKSRSLVKARKRNLKLFKEEFLGTNENALKCKIMNENDITFNYDSDKDTLKAFANNPILIENKALGYKITYYLDKFEYYRMHDAVFFMGNIQFKEDETTPEKQKEYSENRKNAYLGSRMHFIRTLWRNDSILDGFTFSISGYKNLEVKDIAVQDKNSNKYLSFPYTLKIVYANHVSSISFLKKYVFFEKKGYFDGTGINWMGYMGEQRIAEWLPYEYSIE